MKKLFCLLLTVIVVFSVSPTAFAATNQFLQEDDTVIHAVDPENVVFASDQHKPLNMNTSIPARGNYQSLEFAGFDKEVVVLADQSFTRTSSGTIRLEINSCSWQPSTNDVEIGFYRVESGTCYGKTLSGGTVRRTYSFSLPTGTYYVYAMNKGPGRLTSALMYYDVH